MKALRTLAGFAKNKTVSILTLVAAIWAYNKLPEQKVDDAGNIISEAWPLTEVAYAGVSILAVVVIGPFLRMLVFNEAAEYAESGKLDADLAEGSVTPALIHYWFATTICYAAPIACLATLAK